MLFSIVIPTFGRPARLATCLEAIASLDFPPTDFEVVVVDDGGPEDLSGLVSRFSGRVDLRLLREAHRGPASARNAGAAAARGRLLAFTDDDCAPAPDWLARLQAAEAALPGCMLGGRTINALEDRPASVASQLLVDYLYTYFNRDPSHARFVASSNLVVPRGRFERMNGFDVSFPTAAAEDREFCDRWLQEGGRIVVVPEAQVLHRHDLDLHRFWQQHAAYGRGAHRFHRQRATRDGAKVRLEPWRFYSGLLLYPFKAGVPHPARLAALLLLSQVANAVGYFAEARTTPLQA